MNKISEGMSRRTHRDEGDGVQQISMFPFFLSCVFIPSVIPLCVSAPPREKFHNLLPDTEAAEDFAENFLRSRGTDHLTDGGE